MFTQQLADNWVKGDMVQFTTQVRVNFNHLDRQ
jgi:hypothetical protein